MRRTFAILLLALFSLTSVRGILGWAIYSTNSEAIARILCINKDADPVAEPERASCQGMCQARSLVGDQADSDRPTESRLPVLPGPTAYTPEASFDATVTQLRGQSVLFGVDDYLLRQGESGSVFHPPRA